MIDIDRLVEGFFHWTVGTGKSLCGMLAWLTEFGKLPPDQQEVVLTRIKQRGDFKRTCDLVSGRSRTPGW